MAGGAEETWDTSGADGAACGAGRAGRVVSSRPLGGRVVGCAGSRPLGCLGGRVVGCAGSGPLGSSVGGAVGCGEDIVWLPIFCSVCRYTTTKYAYTCINGSTALV